MPLTEEIKVILRAKGREDLIKIDEINSSGYAGISESGSIVDRREYPLAMPIPKNDLLGIPEPKPLN